jgi:hypothetical protein
MMHSSIMNYYQRKFEFVQYHNWSLSDIDELFPWEFEVYQALLSNFLETQELLRQQQLNA